MVRSHPRSPMEGENNQNLNTKGPWWKPAVQIFSDVSTWIAVPIVLALIFGKMLDAHFGTKPVIFLCLVGFSFLVSCVGIYKVVKNYMKKLQNTEKENSQNN